MMALHPSSSDRSPHTGTHPFTSPKIDPINAVTEGIDRILSILKLLHTDFIRPTHTISTALKGVRRRLHVLQDNSRNSSTYTELRAIRKISKQTVASVATLMSKTRNLRRILKDFVYWTDTELMASLASSEPILAGHQDPHGLSASNLELDDEFFDLIDRCVDIVQASWQLNLFLGRLQRQLGSLTVLVPTRGVLFPRASKAPQLKAVSDQAQSNTQRNRRLETSLSQTSAILVKFSKPIDTVYSITVQRLMKRLETLLEERR